MIKRDIKKGDIMRRSISAILVLIVLFAFIGCGEKSKSDEAVTDQVKTESMDFQIRMDPLPFKNVLESLRSVSKELAQQTPTEAYKVSENVYEQSFAIGVISADAVMAISSRDESKLKAYTELLIEYSKNIGLKDEILKMADEIQYVLENNDANKWEHLEKLIYEYQTQVELAFYQEEMLDQYTLMQLGGWSEGLYRITNLYLNNWDQEGAKTINQRGIVNALINNLDLIQSSKIKEADYYRISKEGFAMIKKIIYSIQEDSYYTKDDIKKINEISAKIVNSVRK
jgi:hypothetical protein